MLLSTNPISKHCLITCFRKKEKKKKPDIAGKWMIYPEAKNMQKSKATFTSNELDKKMGPQLQIPKAAKQIILSWIAIRQNTF